MTSEEFEAFLSELDVWIETEDHRHTCIGYSEGQPCCLDEYGHWDEKPFRHWMRSKLVTEI